MRSWQAKVSFEVKIFAQPFEGVIVLEPRQFCDERGFFLESFQADRYRSLGIDEDFVQDNHSRSTKGVLRGLHFNKNKQQAQILTVVRGRIFDVVVDIRKNSTTYGRWYGIELSDEGPRQIYMSDGFAHGFCVLSDFADLHYKVSQKYNALDDGGLRWNDKSIGISWPISEAIISERDSQHPLLHEIVEINK